VPPLSLFKENKTAIVASMTQPELLEIVACGETSRVQFKETLDNNDSIAAEIIALANTKGGMILFGIQDKTGAVKGLTYQQIQEIGNKVASIATELIKPQVFITTDVVPLHCDENVQHVLVVMVDEGIAKPYKDRFGVIWVKQGGDKRRLTDNNQQLRLFQQSGLVYVDEMIVPDTSFADVYKDKVQEYLEKMQDDSIDLEEIDEQLCKNLNILKGAFLTLGGLLFFGKRPQKTRPAFCVKAVSFIGNDISSVDYRESRDITGTIPVMYQESLAFFDRHLFRTQQGQDFNSTGILEISEVALQELMQNALTHRDYTKNAPIRIFIFDNRIEIISPGCLPNSLTIENIKLGNAVIRNNLIVSYASKLMRYRGIGSGIARALKRQPDIIFQDDREGEQFKVTIPRPPRP